jgi:hypothetical protein
MSPQAPWRCSPQRAKDVVQQREKYSRVAPAQRRVPRWLGPFSRHRKSVTRSASAARVDKCRPDLSPARRSYCAGESCSGVAQC